MINQTEKDFVFFFDNMDDIVSSGHFQTLTSYRALIDNII